MQRFGVALEQFLAGPDHSRRYNIAPGQMAVIITAGQARRASLARFGTDTGHQNMLINARSETLSDKPTFRDAFAMHRCIVPASGWFEWQGKSRPFYIQLNDSRVMGLAGLYFPAPSSGHPGFAEPADNNRPDSADRFVIVTTAAQGHLADLHHRTPLVLDRSGWSDWLAGPMAAATSWLRPPPAKYFRSHPVDPAVGKVANDHAGLVNPVDSHPPDLFASPPDE